jgi:hypothetical protein
MVKKGKKQKKKVRKDKRSDLHKCISETLKMLNDSSWDDYSLN